MPEQERFAELLESLADGAPIDWAAAESATTSDDDRAWLRQLRRLELAVARQRRVPARGATWSHLELIEKIGAGAFGEVFRAHDPRLARDVALKLLYEPIFADGPRASAVIEEGRLLARVRHPNVVTVYGAESRDGQVGIWTEFIDGQTLQAIVAERGPLPAAEVTAIGVDLCRALAAVHDAGLLHRDIKAQNVMREAGGRIVLMDFGTGRDLDPLPGQKTDVSGTPLYLAPELFKGGEASAASDVYALGVLLFFLLTGKYPVSGSTLGEVRDAHLVGMTKLLRAVEPTCSSGIADAIDRALSRDPDRRFASAREFAHALAATQPAVLGLPTNAPSPGAHARRTYLGLASVLTAVMVLAGGVWWALARQGSELANPVPPVASSADGEQAVRESAGSAVTPAAPVDETSSSTPPPPVPEGPRTVLEDLRDEMASITSDGRLLAKRDRDPEQKPTGDIAIQHLADLSIIRLGLKTGVDDGRADQPVISRNGRRVAYRWSPSGGGPARLGVVDLPRAPGTQPQLLAGEDSGTSVQWVHDWSPDDRRVLVTLGASKSSERRLVWVSTSEHRIDTVKTFDEATFIIHPPAKVSAAGYIAYSAKEIPAGASNAADYIYVLRKDGSEEKVVNSAASNRAPLWSPDGTRLVYTSDSSGNTDLCSLPIRDGRVSGERLVVRRNIGSGTAIALTDDYSYFYRPYEPGLDQIFIAALADNRNPSAERLVFTRMFEGFRPTWSPDGRALAFLRSRPEAISAVVAPLPTGNEVIVRRSVSSAPGIPAWPMLWLDNESLLLQSIVAPQRPELNRLTAFATDRMTNIGPPPQSGIWRTWAAALSPGSKTLYSVARAAEQGPWDRLVAIEVATGATTVPFLLPPDLAAAGAFQNVGLALSPHGDELAVSLLLPDGKARLFTVGVDGQRYRSLISYSAALTMGNLAWTKDGIYFSEVVSVESPQGARPRSRVMRILPGETVARAVLEINGNNSEASFDVSPDGLRIAIHPNPQAKQPFSPDAGAQYRLWVMDLARPPARARR